MRSIHLFLLGIAAVLVILVLNLAPTHATSSLTVETNPPLNEVVPFTDPVALSLTALDETGAPVTDAIFDITLLTPPKTPWLTSDFPIVEGTTLLATTLEAADGTAAFETTLPIRGPYQLQVGVSPQVPGSFEPYTEAVTLQVPENPAKYWNALILVSVLFLIGLGGGWIIGGEQDVRLGETAPRRVQWLLSSAAMIVIATLLTISFMTERAEAHGDHDHGESEAALEELLEANPVPAEITAELVDQAPAIVGQLVPFSVTVADVNGSNIENAVINIEAQAMGYDRPVLRLSGQSDAQGTFIWQQQFFDGAPHKVMVQVAPDPSSDVPLEPFALAERIEVEAVAPPILTRLIGLTYFTAFLAAGTALGYWLKQRRSLATP